MAKKILSFLGTSKYQEVYHFFGEKKVKSPHRFVQVALMELLCSDWGEEDELIVIMTEESKNKNWLNQSENNQANFEKGLRDSLEEAKKNMGLSLKIVPVEVKEGKSEAELWDMFDTILNTLREEDVIINDITHSFRSIPMLTLILLNYARITKGIKIEKIVYAALESLGNPREIGNIPLENRIVPIFDLTPFVTLFDWSIAIDRFIEKGDAEFLHKVGMETLVPILSKTRGKQGRSTRKLLDTIKNFTEDVETCRVYEFQQKVKNINQTIPRAEGEIEAGLVKPMYPLFHRVKSLFSSMESQDIVINNLNVAKWCYERGLVQQGITIVREEIVNYILLSSGIVDLKDSQKRKLAENYINNLLSKKVESGGQEAKKDEIESISFPIDEKKASKLSEIWGKIREYRNDINHGGWRKGSKGSNKFKKALKEVIDDLFDIVSS